MRVRLLHAEPDALRSTFPRSAPRLLEMHLAELAVSRRRSVAALAAVTRASVLGACITQTIAVDVA
jgi:hypothetical protein